MMALAAQNPQLDPDGFHHANINLILGLLYKVTRQRERAVRHLTHARHIARRYGGTMLARIDASLAELGVAEVR
jgi:hypothetical protein